MPTDPSTRTLWTVPQVATWIRYRDVERLTDVGEEEQPFERTAREAILKALENGNLTAYAHEHPIDAEFWGRGTVLVQRGRKGATLYRSYDPVMLDNYDCMRIWRPPAELLNTHGISLRVLLNQLGEDQGQDTAGPIAHWFLRLPGVLVRGLNSLGDRIEIDTQALIGATIGRHDDLIVGGHGQLRWHVVTVELRPQRDSNAERPINPPSGRTAEDEEIKAWIASKQLSLKNAGLKHGRDVVLKAARDRFGLPRKAVLAIWNSGAAQRRPGRPKAR